MKANRKFVEEERAVSAVIGVILMVAITVAIAATVYVYVSGMIGGTPTTAPNIQFNIDESHDRLIVSHTETGAAWEDLSIRADAAVTVYINGEETAAGGEGTALTADSLTDIVDGMMAGGDASAAVEGSDFIDIEGTSGDLEDVTITIVHKDTGTVLGTYTFASISKVA